jgi:predicted lipid carrier protein YhbT
MVSDIRVSLLGARRHKEFAMNLKPFTLPKPLGAMLSLLPQYPHSLLFTQALNLALGRVIPADALEPLQGKSMAIRVTDAGVSFNFTLQGKAFVAAGAGNMPDLTISATAYDFLMLALRKEDPDTLFFSRRLLMEGDTELGLLVKNTLDGLDVPPFDPSALLPGRVFDGLARRLAVPGRYPLAR